MIVTAWNDGKHLPGGGGYGVKIKEEDREKFFSPKWYSISLMLEGEKSSVEININKKSFWYGSCRELISYRIGKWFFKNNLAPWKKGNPPKLILEQIKNNQFYLYRDKVR